MKFKTTGILILALAASLGYYFWSQRGGKPAQPPSDQPLSATGDGQALLPFDSGSVDQITIIDSGGLRTTVHKTGDSWWMIEPIIAPASADTARALSDALTGLRSSGLPSSDPGAASGLDKPQFTVELTTDDGKTSTLYVGQKTGLGDLLYARVDGGDINLIDGQAADALKAAEGNLRDKHLLKFQPEDIKQFGIIRPGYHLVLARFGDKWRIVEPVQLRAEDSMAIGVLQTMQGIEASEFLKPDSDELAYARFDHPTVTAWLSTRAPDASQLNGAASCPAATEPGPLPSDVTLTLGAPDSLLKDHYFARTGDGQLAKVAASVMNNLTVLRVSDMRDLTLVSVAPQDVVGITVIKGTYVVPAAGAQQTAPAAPVSEDVTALRRTPPQALGPSTTRVTAAAGSEWQFVNDPKSQVDDSKVQALLAYFFPLRATAYYATPPNIAMQWKYTVVLTTASNQYRLEIELPSDGGPGVGFYNGLAFQYKPVFLDAVAADFHLGAM
jgi:hypothetical protein